MCLETFLYTDYLFKIHWGEIFATAKLHLISEKIGLTFS